MRRNSFVGSVIAGFAGAATYRYLNRRNAQPESIEELRSRLAKMETEERVILGSRSE